MGRYRTGLNGERLYSKRHNVTRWKEGDGAKPKRVGEKGNTTRRRRDETRPDVIWRDGTKGNGMWEGGDGSEQDTTNYHLTEIDWRRRESM